MNLVGFILVFGCGTVVGLILYPLAASMKYGGGFSVVLEALGSLILFPFSLIRSCAQRIRQPNCVGRSVKDEPSPKADNESLQFAESVKTINSILLTLATVIQRTDKAASDSSKALGEVRNSIDRMELPTDLKKAHSILIQEIDRVVSHNSILKGELANSQESLASQRSKIDELQTAVRIDGLTKLANRAGFDEKLSEMIKMLNRYNESFCLLMIDVDNFKTINDSYGHAGGDRVLKGVALKIKACFRGTDFMARYGGDEFAVILMKTNAATAEDVAWKLCASVRDSKFLLDASQIAITLSIGVAEVCPGDTAENLLKRADAALYKVKEAGRNNVRLAESPARGVPDSSLT